MKARHCLWISVISCCMWAAWTSAADDVSLHETGQIIFQDSFTEPQLAPQWRVVSGRWLIEDGCLVNRQGGQIVLGQSAGSNFVLDLEVNFPRWMAQFPWVAVYTHYADSQTYGAAYLNPGESACELFDRDGGIYEVNYKGRYVFDRSRFHQVRLICRPGKVNLLLDGKPMGSANMVSRAGSVIGFGGHEQGVHYRIRNVSVRQIEPEPVDVVAAVGAKQWAEAVIWRDYRYVGRSFPDESLKVDQQHAAAVLDYAFIDPNVFESCFARATTDIKPCAAVYLDVTSDGSGNKLFLIVHDCTGEQHLLGKTYLSWQGTETLRFDMRSFLAAPRFNRYGTHWGGDMNQVIDFPIRAIDIGVAKRTAARQSHGRISFRNIRFAR